VSEDQGQHNNFAASNEASEQAIASKRSYWPLVLAASLTLTLVGVILMTYPIVFWVGIVFVIVSFIGWGLERH
jgi:cytochrome c oxidase subunit IV